MMFNKQIVLAELDLKNFRCFRKFEKPVSFHPKLTVFVARNGNGKSAILDALRISLGTFTKAFETLSQTNISKSDASLTPERIIGGKGALYPVRIEARGLVEGIEATWSRSLMDVNGHTTSKDAKAVSSYGKRLMDGVVSGGGEVELPIIAYYGTGRLWGDDRLSQRELNRDFASENRFVGYEDALTTNSIYAQVKRWMAYAFQVKSNPVEKDTAVGRAVSLQYAAVEKAVNEVLKDTGFHSPHYNFTDRDVSIVCENADGNKISIPVSRTSDGIKAAVSLVADIAYRCARLNPIYGDAVCENTQGVVLIDEVDLFLHPSWQQHFLSDLQRIFPQIQFVVTTHSPQVISSVSRECVRVISDGCVYSPNMPTQGVEINDLLLGVFGTAPVPNQLDIVQKLNRLLVLAAEGSERADEWNPLYEELLAHYGPNYGPLAGAAHQRDFIRRMKRERAHA